MLLIAIEPESKQQTKTELILFLSNCISINVEKKTNKLNRKRDGLCIT